MKTQTPSPIQKLLALAGTLATLTAITEAAVVTNPDQMLVNSANNTTAGGFGNPSRSNFGGENGGTIGNIFSVSTTQLAASLGFVDLLNTATASEGGSLGGINARARPASGKGDASASLTENGGGDIPGGAWTNSGDGLLTSHTVVLVEWNSVTPADSPILASVPVGAGTSAYYFNGFRWVDLDAQVTLDPSKTYAVLANVFMQPLGLLGEGDNLTHDAWVTNPGTQGGNTNYLLGDDFGTSIGSTAYAPTSNLFLNNSGPLPTSGTLDMTPLGNGNLVYATANVAIVPVPEPSAATLIGVLAALSLLRRRR